MTLKEALRIVKEFGFEKKTVTSNQSGCDETYHYFTYSIGDISFMLSNDDNPNVWFGTIFDYGVKFYTINSFVSVLLAIKNGEWNES